MLDFMCLHHQLHRDSITFFFTSCDFSAFSLCFSSFRGKERGREGGRERGKQEGRKAGRRGREVQEKERMDTSSTTHISEREWPDVDGKCTLN